MPLINPFVAAWISSWIVPLIIRLHHFKWFLIRPLSLLISVYHLCISACCSFFFILFLITVYVQYYLIFHPVVLSSSPGLFQLSLFLGNFASWILLNLQNRILWYSSGNCNSRYVKARMMLFLCFCFCLFVSSFKILVLIGLFVFSLKKTSRILFFYLWMNICLLTFNSIAIWISFLDLDGRSMCIIFKPVFGV